MSNEAQGQYNFRLAIFDCRMQGQGPVAIAHEWGLGEMGNWASIVKTRKNVEEETLF
jgi:hypothetical protein